jgi:gliding motility-associated-like protein
MNSEDVDIAESNEIINAVDVSLMNIVCNGENNGALTVNTVSGGTGPFTYQWSGTSQSGTTLTALGPGIYTLTVSDANGCSFIESYQITEPDLVTLDLGPDKTVNVDDSVSIALSTNLTPGATSSIEWSQYDGLSCAGCTKFEFIAVSSATISAMISDTSGCVAEDSMRLRVLVPRVYFIPNVFSPNGDGINDYFFVSGKANLTNVIYLKVFDRWGNQLFEKPDMQPGVVSEGWDGKFDGKYMLPGVYAYIAELDFEGIIETVTGEVTIIR